MRSSAKIKSAIGFPVLKTRIAKERGAAITEFIIVSIVLVPIFLMVPMMGKIGDMNSSTIQASRYAAWERTVSNNQDKSDAQLQLELQNRFYTKNTIGIQTGRGTLNTAADQNSLWRSYAGKRFLKSPQDDVKSKTQNSATPGRGAAVIAQVMVKIADAFSTFNDEANFDVNMNGLYRGDVSVNVASSKMGFVGTKNCNGQDDTDVFACIRRHNVILADGWSSESKQKADSRVRSLVPLGMFAEIQPIFSIAGNIPFMTELSYFEPGYVDSDIIAPDRLGTYP